MKDGTFARRLPESALLRRLALPVALLVCFLSFQIPEAQCRPGAEDAAAAEESRGVRPVTEAADTARATTAQTLELRNVRRHLVKNRALGELLVIDGTVVNRSDAPVSNVSVALAGLDGNSDPVSTRLQWAGVRLSPKKVAAMTSFEEIDRILHDRKAIARANVNVPPYGRIPFTFVLQPLRHDLKYIVSAYPGYDRGTMPAHQWFPSDERPAGETKRSRKAAGRKPAEAPKTLELQNVRRYTLNTGGPGRILVIEGMVENRGEGPVSNVIVGVEGFDRRRRPVLERYQMAGVLLPTTRLSVMSAEEVERSLSDPTAIANANTNVPPNGKIPFTFVFFRPSDRVVNYVVSVYPEAAEEPDGGSFFDRETPAAPAAPSAPSDRAGTGDAAGSADRKPGEETLPSDIDEQLRYLEELTRGASSI